MTRATDEPGRPRLACVRVAGARAPLAVLEALTPARDELPAVLSALRLRADVDQMCLVSTCERVELYAFDAAGLDQEALLAALADVRATSLDSVTLAADVLTGSDAARHLLRVASGLESFVLGESDVVGQVRAAAAAARAAGVGGFELERLVARAVNTSRRVRGSTSFAESGRSVAATAIDVAAAELSGGLHGRRVLVVGGGEVAGQAVDSAMRRGAQVTVCARTRRRAARLAEAGARLVALECLPELLPTVDVVVFATASPEPLLELAQVGRTLGGNKRTVMLLDLCLPRNVDPGVRGTPGVRLLDLADLRALSTAQDDHLTRDIARATELVERELTRYQRWLARRRAAASIQRLRADLEACASGQAAAATRGLPEEVRPLVAESIRRSLLSLAHGPTQHVLMAAEAGDDRTVELLGGIFSDAVRPRSE